MGMLMLLKRDGECSQHIQTRARTSNPTALNDDDDDDEMIFSSRKFLISRIGMRTKRESIAERENDKISIWLY